MDALNIGQAATASGVTAKMIRHYEEIGLMPKVRRTLAGYRMYSPNDVHILKFIKQSRNLGFSMKQIEALLGLWRDTRRPSSKVKALAQEHVIELEQKIHEMEAMRATLQRLVTTCHGDDRPDCPILDELALEHAPLAPAKTAAPAAPAAPATPATPASKVHKQKRIGKHTGKKKSHECH